MNEKTGTGVCSEKEKVEEAQSRSVTPSLDTPSGAGLGASHYVLCTIHYYYILCTIHYALFTMHYALCIHIYTYSYVFTILYVFIRIHYFTWKSNEIQ